MCLVAHVGGGVAWGGGLSCEFKCTQRKVVINVTGNSGAELRRFNMIT